MTVVSDRKNRPGSLARWVSWIFGFAVLACVIMFAAHYREEKDLAQLLRDTRPAWLIVALLLQMGTYTTDARIWQQVIERTGISRRLRSYVGLGLAKLFIDQDIPSVGVSGTLLIVRALERRGLPRGASMAAVVVDVIAHNIAYVLALGIALTIIWINGQLVLLVAMPAVVFAFLAAAVPVVLLWMNRNRTLARWLMQLPFIKPVIEALAEATPAIVGDASLRTQCTALHLALYALDSATLWVMLRAIGIEVDPLRVFASFMLATLAQTLGVSPGGIGVFEATSTATLRLIGVPVAAGLEATILFRFLTFWLPMAPGLILAQREAKDR